MGGKLKLTIFDNFSKMISERSFKVNPIWYYSISLQVYGYVRQIKHVHILKHIVLIIINFIGMYCIEYVSKKQDMLKNLQIKNISKHVSNSKDKKFGHNKNKILNIYYNNIRQEYLHLHFYISRIQYYDNNLNQYIDSLKLLVSLKDNVKYDDVSVIAPNIQYINLSYHLLIYQNNNDKILEYHAMEKFIVPGLFGNINKWCIPLSILYKGKNNLYNLALLNNESDLQICLFVTNIELIKSQFLFEIAKPLSIQQQKK